MEKRKGKREREKEKKMRPFQIKNKGRPVLCLVLEWRKLFLKILGNGIAYFHGS